MSKESQQTETDTCSFGTACIRPIMDKYVAICGMDDTHAVHFMCLKESLRRKRLMLYPVPKDPVKCPVCGDTYIQEVFDMIYNETRLFSRGMELPSALP
jgi:hypothetical protein